MSSHRAQSRWSGPCLRTSSVPAAEVMRLVRIPLAAVDGQEEAQAQDHVQLGRDDPLVVVQVEQDEVDDAVGQLQLRALVALQHVLDDERMERQRGADRLDLGVRRAGQVDPDARLGLAQELRQLLDRLGAADVMERVADHRADAQDARGVGPGRGAAAVATGSPARRCLGSAAGLGPGTVRSPSGSRPPAGAARGSAGSSASIRGRPPSTRDGGMATAVTAAATRNSPTMIRAASLEAHASSASTTSGSRSGRSRSSSGMNWRYASGVA